MCSVGKERKWSKLRAHERISGNRMARRLPKEYTAQERTVGQRDKDSQNLPLLVIPRLAGSKEYSWEMV